MQIHKFKYDFNQRLLKLRDKKIRLIEEIRDLASKLEVVQAKLPEEEVKDIPPVPEMHVDELPEK